MTKEELDAYEAGKLAGIAQQTILELRGEVIDIRANQKAILEKIEELEEKIDSLDKWRWVVVGATSAVTMLVGIVWSWIKNIGK